MLGEFSTLYHVSLAVRSVFVHCLSIVTHNRGYNLRLEGCAQQHEGSRARLPSWPAAGLVATWPPLPAAAQLPSVGVHLFLKGGGIFWANPKVKLESMGIWLMDLVDSFTTQMHI